MLNKPIYQAKHFMLFITNDLATSMANLVPERLNLTRGRTFLLVSLAL